MIKKIYFSKIESTNDYAIKNIEELADRSVIFAEIQTKGKGRNGRLWYSEKNNLFASLILKPQLCFDELYKLTGFVHYAAVILTRVFKKHYNIKTLIKWPNDVFADGKKIAGILIETVIRGECLQGIVLGIGVNLNMSEESLKKIDKSATSLNILSGIEIKRDEFLEHFLEEFFLQYNKFLKQGFTLIKKEYSLLSMILGKKVNVISSGKKYIGDALNIDEKGRIVLKCSDKVIALNIGDVTLL